MTRRSFLAITGAAPFVLHGWGAAQSRPPLGIQLYAVRNDLERDLVGTLRSVGKLGYTIVEFYSPYFTYTPQLVNDIRRLMDDLGIQCRSTHNNAGYLRPENIQKAIDLNQMLGSTALIVSDPGRVSGTAGWSAFAERMTAATERLRSSKMAAGFHNHQREWRPIGGQRPMDILAANTPRDFVLQFDVGTCVEAGADPVAWIKANPGRIKSIHLKDWGAGPARGYSVLFGEGDVKWPPIFEAAESVGGVEYYLMEQEEGPADEQMLRAGQCFATYYKMRA
jgi:sugar phosphate isomerase/epimerase